MGLHAFTEYLKYRWKAKGRHGTHSPFVYALVEDVLQGDVVGRGIVMDGFKGKRYGKLLSAMAEYFNYKAVLDLNVGFDFPLPASKGEYQEHEMVILPETNPEKWAVDLYIYISVIEKGGLIVVPAIHKTKAYTGKWDELRADKSVKLSIDLYGIGLLFAMEAFKEKQHFVLKVR